MPVQKKRKRTQTLKKLRRQICVDGDDLVYEILPRLPIKALLRFKSVCKPWKKMIEDPYLALKQLRRPAQETDMKLMVHYSMSGTKEFSSVISKEMIEIATPENQNHHLACDFNGLYLFCHEKDSSFPLILFNPVTQETIQLPHASPSTQFDGKHIREVHGLGFDVGNGVFKVIRFTMDIDYVCRKPEILTLGHKTWKQLELPACLHGIPNYSGTIFLNGAIHCVFKRQDHHHILVAFDVIKEEFRSIKSPSISLPRCTLMNMGGSLAIYAGRNDAAPGSHYIYLLKDYNKGEWCVESNLLITCAANYEKSSGVSATIGNQIIFYNFGSDAFFDMETRQRTVEETMAQVTRLSPIIANAPLMNQLTLLPLSQYRTSPAKFENELKRLQ